MLLRRCFLEPVFAQKVKAPLKFNRYSALKGKNQSLKWPSTLGMQLPAFYSGDATGRYVQPDLIRFIDHCTTRRRMH